MSEKLNKLIPFIPVLVAVLALFFTVFQTLIVNRASLKNEQLDSFINWQHATQKLSCYYNHAEDKTVYSEDITQAYSDIQEKLKNTPDDLRAEIGIVDGFGINSLNRALNERIVWSYEFYGAYYNDFVEIKSSLNNKELSNAVRNCESKL